MLVPLLLNWYANPYHASILVAKARNLYTDRNIDLCLLEPTNPSEVTKIIGKGHVPLGLKAMVHCYAARHRGYPIQSIGTILDEPPTGLISPISKGIQNITDIEGKRLGYVGEFGKVMIDKLAQEAGIATSSYTLVRTGMHAARAIIKNEVDAAIGLSCFQQIEIEEAGIPAQMLRIDQAANLGCCCFCSIVMIGYESYLKSNASMLKELMAATIQGAEFTREYPEEAFACITRIKPDLDTPLFKKIFYRTLPFISKDCLNVDRDWKKVGKYAKKLGIADDCSDLSQYYTNALVPLKEMTPA